MPGIAKPAIMVSADCQFGGRPSGARIVIAVHAIMGDVYGFSTPSPSSPRPMDYPCPETTGRGIVMVDRFPLGRWVGHEGYDDFDAAMSALWERCQAARRSSRASTLGATLRRVTGCLPHHGRPGRPPDWPQLDGWPNGREPEGG
jgi:hypothetical protein